MLKGDHTDIQVNKRRNYERKISDSSDTSDVPVREVTSEELGARRRRWRRQEMEGPKKYATEEEES